MINTEWLQVHGHRNTSSLPIKAADKSYNLEAGVEFGGNLRIMTIAKDNKVAEIEIRNNIFCKEASPKAFKATTENEEYKISKSTFEKLHKHNYINRKYFDSYPHITSYNFSRKALTKGIWDKVNLTARGLFIDNDLNIVVRSYDKFFNLGEKRETELYNLQKNLLFPLTLFVKENGFLGLLGYDIKNDRLFFSSKSTPESDFTGWFKEILTTSLNESQMDYLHKTVKDRNLSLVFEVNDPVNDPHMIEYNQRHVVLLDAVVRSEKFKRLDFHEIEQIAISLGVSHKQKAMVFNKWDAFEEWYKNMVEQGQDYTFHGKQIEGFVAEDSNGFMFKIKMSYYSFWKSIRSLKERIILVRKTGGNLKRNLSEPEVSAFYKWAIMQPDEILERDIIWVRKIYLASRNSL
nr:T4 RnlA family RNA ligase [Rickettsia endosymbiont of Ceutorhynchus assimilis]